MARVMSGLSRAMGLVIIIAIWLIVSPFVLGYANALPAVWNNLVVGIIALLVGAYAVFGGTQREAVGWGVAALGVWEIIAPFVLGFANSPLLWNNVIVGLLLVVVGAFVARLAWGRGLAGG